MRPSKLIKPLVRWVPYADGRPGLHPTWPYEIWARVFGVEQDVWRLWKWRVVAPLRRVCGLPYTTWYPGGGRKGWWK